MNFWDSSACLPLVIREPTTTTMLHWYEQADHVVVWTLTPVEVASALCRLLRDRKLTEAQAQRAFLGWGGLAKGFHVVKDVESVKQRAIRLLRVHTLKSADALQLAAALVACSEAPTTHHFITLDEKLARAAQREGFVVPSVAG